MGKKTMNNKRTMNDTVTSKTKSQRLKCINSEKMRSTKRRPAQIRHIKISPEKTSYGCHPVRKKPIAYKQSTMHSSILKIKKWSVMLRFNSPRLQNKSKGNIKIDKL